MNYRAIECGKSRLFYNPDSGEFIRQFNGGKVNRNVGTLNSCGYLQIKALGKYIRAHRLAFIAMGKDLPAQVDHINGIKTDNAWGNLRGCTNMENQQNSGLQSNNKTGVKGVYWIDRFKKYQASVRFNGVNHTKYFNDLEVAALWAEAKRDELHGEYANHGKALKELIK